MHVILVASTKDAKGLIANTYEVVFFTLCGVRSCLLSVGLVFASTTTIK